MVESEFCFWDSLEQSLPPIVPRKAIATLTGGLISRGRLANLDSKGLGPKGRVRIGRSICYGKYELIAWLKKRATSTDSQ